METTVQIVDIFILRHLPEILAWAVGIVLGIILLRRGGDRAGKLFLAGCALLFVARLGAPVVNQIVRSIGYELFMSNFAIAQTMGWASLPFAVITLAGLVCLVWAFWLMFHRAGQVTE